jgi:hypothetical protein
MVEKPPSDEDIRELALPSILFVPHGIPVLRCLQLTEWLCGNCTSWLGLRNFLPLHWL